MQTTDKGVPQTTKPDKPSQDIIFAGHSIQMSSIIGGILQGGVIVSACFIVLGLILLPLRPGGLSHARIAHFPHTLADLWSELLGLHPQAIITLGLLLLILTPVLRVAVSVIAFALEHDRKYVIITLIVLAVLITSFVLGKGGA